MKWQGADDSWRGKLRSWVTWKTRRLNRRELFWWIRGLAKVGDGEVMPQWLVAIMFVLFPSRVGTWWACRFYDPWRNSVRIGNVWISWFQLETFLGGPTRPGLWFRVKEVYPNGMVNIEMRDSSLPEKNGKTEVTRT